MDIKTGRPNHINDALAQLHRNIWYEYTSKEQVYANLILTEKIGIGGELINNPVTELPSEETVNAKLKELQDDFDEKNKEYKVSRGQEYPPIKDQLDKIYHDMNAEKGDKTGEWFKVIKKVKDDNPKT